MTTRATLLFHVVGFNVHQSGVLTASTFHSSRFSEAGINLYPTAGPCGETSKQKLSLSNYTEYTGVLTMLYQCSLAAKQLNTKVSMSTVLSNINESQ